MGEMKQFVHQFGCWQSFSAQRSCIVLAFSSIPCEERERESEWERAPKKSRKHCHGSFFRISRAWRSSYRCVQSCSNLSPRLTISLVPLAVFRADMDGLTAKAPRRKWRVGERHFHHTAAEGGNRWKVNFGKEGTEIQLYRWKPKKKRKNKSGGNKDSKDDATER